jgi:DNA gyrase/topoisomerase IV subunit A
MNKAIGKLWDMFSESKQGRINDALDYMEKEFEFKDQIKRLTSDLRTSEAVAAKVVQEKQVTLANKAIAEQALIEARAELQQKKITEATTVKLHKYLLIKAEKERDQCKEEKRKLEHIISELQRQKEGYRAKLKKIKDLAEM